MFFWVIQLTSWMTNTDEGLRVTLATGFCPVLDLIYTLLPLTVSNY